MGIIKFEHTDTFGGESNYSWVRREEHEIDESKKPLSDRAIVRRAKAFAGFTGRASRVENCGDFIAIWPRGLCQVCFVTFEY
jgi:hypothetical protein